MQKVKQKFLFVVMIATMLISFSNMAIVNAENEGEACAHMEGVKLEFKALRPHLHFYYQLLAEKYAPDQVKGWTEVIKEREVLFKKYRELAKSGKINGKFYDETWLKTHSEIQQQLLDAVQKRDENALKNIVPKMLDHQKELNSLLKDRLKEIK